MPADRTLHFFRDREAVRMVKLDGVSTVNRLTIPKPPTSGSMNAVLEPVARRLGMTPEQLAAELRTGKSLDAIAATKGVSHRDLVDAIKQGLETTKPARFRIVDLSHQAERMSKSVFLAP